MTGLKWSNGYGDEYGVVHKVTRHKRTTCRACREGNEGGLEKPEFVVEIIAHSGPAGSLMLCKPHALIFAEMIKETADSIED